MKYVVKNPEVLRKFIKHNTKSIKEGDTISLDSHNPATIAAINVGAIERAAVV